MAGYTVYPKAGLRLPPFSLYSNLRPRFLRGISADRIPMTARDSGGRAALCASPVTLLVSFDFAHDASRVECCYSIPYL